MKKAFIFLVLILPSTLVFSQIYQENFGSGPNYSESLVNQMPPVTNYQHFQQGSPIIYSGNAEITGPYNSATGYQTSWGYTGASDWGYAVLSSGSTNNDHYIIIDGINTANMVNPKLTLGTSTSSSQTNQLQLHYWNTSNSTWTNVSITQPVHTSNGSWTLCTSGVLPSKTSLKIRLLNHYTVTAQYQYTQVFLDDLKITYTSLGLNEESLNNFIVYPNPTKDKFTIDFGNQIISNNTIKINNLLGQEVYSTTIIDKTQVEVFNTWQGKGLYFVRIYDENNSLLTTKKIILQ